MTGFEGGQIPMIRRIPKRGFRHTAFQKPCAIINLSELDKRFTANDEVSPSDSAESLRLMNKGERLKVLGGSEV